MSVHKLHIEGFQPARLNQLMAGHWARSFTLKKGDRQLIALAARLQDIPLATGRRRVSLVLTLGPRQRAGDPGHS